MSEPEEEVEGQKLIAFPVLLQACSRIPEIPTLLSAGWLPRQWLPWPAWSPIPSIQCGVEWWCSQDAKEVGCQSTVHALKTALTTWSSFLLIAILRVTVHCNINLVYYIVLQWGNAVRLNLKLSGFMLRTFHYGTWNKRKGLPVCIVRLNRAIKKKA